MRKQKKQIDLLGEMLPNGHVVPPQIDQQHMGF